MNINDTNFIKQIKKKDAEALNFVVDNYSNLVFKVVRSVLNLSFYECSVGECVNDIFWAVWNNIESFDEEKGEFKYWITAIKGKKPAEVSVVMDGGYPKELSQGNMGKIIIKDVKIEKDKTVVKFAAVGKAPYFQATSLHIKDNKGETITPKSYNMHRSEEKPNEFILEFPLLDWSKKYIIYTNDFSNVEFREDLKFKIELN